MTKYLSIITLFFGTIVSAFSYAAPYAQTIDAITDAAYQGKKDELERHAQHADNYTRAYALYRLAQIEMPTSNLATHAQRLNEAEDLLLNRPDAESKVLLGHIYGLMIAKNPTLSMQLGQEIGALLEQTKTHQSAAGRALLLDGIGKLHTPLGYGGGINEAQKVLEQAAAHFEASSQDTDLRWGDVETQIWLGVAYAKQNKVAQAKAAFKQALEIAPRCEWVHHFAQTSGIQL